jgi:hypothetical protein
MAIRREAMAAYARAVAANPERTRLDRAGSSLASCGDTDIVLSALADGWRVAYVPELKLHHIIRARRVTRAYLAQLKHEAARSWVYVLTYHGICPWPEIPFWSVPLRKAKAYIAHRAWRSDSNYIHWRGACGNFEGRALVGAQGKSGERVQKHFSGR